MSNLKKLLDMRRQLFYFLLLFMAVLTSSGQEQWFPVKFDSLTKKHYPDTSIVFPVPYISKNKNKVTLYAHKSPYTRQMKFTKKGFYSDGLSISYNPIDDTLRKSFANAKYYFEIKGDNGILIINRSNKTDTINFLKSKTLVSELKFKWG